MYVSMNIGWVGNVYCVVFSLVIGLCVASLVASLVLALRWERPRERKNVLHSVLTTRIAETNWFKQPCWVRSNQLRTICEANGESRGERPFALALVSTRRRWRSSRFARQKGRAGQRSEARRKAVGMRPRSASESFARREKSEGGGGELGLDTKWRNKTSSQHRGLLAQRNWLATNGRCR